MSKRCILVSFPHFPYTLETLLPDSLLAGIAGSLLDAGHRPLVFDYGTIEILQRYLPASDRRVSSFLANEMVGNASGSLSALTAFLRLRGLGSHRRAREETVRRELAAEASRDIAGIGRVDLVVLKLREAADAADAILLAHQLRRVRADVPIAVAGTFVEQYGELLARRTGAFDCLVLGDPEWTLARFAEVVDRPELWTEVPNLALVRGGSVRITRRKRADLNGVAIPAYSTDLYPALHGDGKFKVLGVACTRVCQQQCPACHHAERQPGLSRPRAPKSVCDAVADAMERQGVCAFMLEGPSFSETYAVSLAREMLLRGLAVLYGREASVRETRVANLATFRASGCQVLSFRVDTGSQWLLEDYYRRGFSVSQCEKVVRSTSDAGICTVTQFTYPCPADDYHTKAETLRLIERTRPAAALIQLPIPVPGAEWTERSEEYGFRMDFARFLSKTIDTGHPSEIRFVPWRTLRNARRQVSLRQAIRELDDLRAQIRCAGVSTHLTPAMSLVARVSGYENCEGDFATLFQRRLAEADIAGIADAAALFNRRAALSAQRTAAGIYRPILAAAGN